MQTELIDLVTPNSYQLHGVWVGPSNPKKVFIFVHGLTSNLFSGRMIFPLVDKDTAVLSFNNRGRDIISKLKHLNPSHPKGYDSEVAGTAHEVFEDCVDDIQGAVSFAQSRNVKEVYLVGHSTGCQKSVFYLSKTKNKQKVSGAVLICPVSDYTTTSIEADKTQYENALKFAQKEVEEGRAHTLIPTEYWPNELLDAQRFISLYTPDSSEEVFCYSQKGKEPAILKSVTAPLMPIIAGSDEYLDRPAVELLSWFKANNNSNKYKGVIIDGALHNLSGYEEKLRDEINAWAK